MFAGLDSMDENAQQVFDSHKRQANMTHLLLSRDMVDLVNRIEWSQRQATGW